MIRDSVEDGDKSSKERKRKKKKFFEKINPKNSSETSEDLKNLLLRYAKTKFWKA